MIKYNSLSNMLEYETKNISQNSGVFSLDINVDNYQSNCKYFLEIKCPKERCFISKEISFIENIGTLDLGEQITKEIGNVYFQLVKRSINGEILGKSILSKQPVFKVIKSINAVEKIDYNRVGDCIENIIEKTNQLGQLHDDIKKKFENGELKGEKGEPGIGTLIKVNGVVQKEIDFKENPQYQIDNKIDLNGGEMNVNAQLKWTECNNIDTFMGYSSNKEAFIIASLNNGQSDNLTIFPKDKKICWRGRELVTSDYWKPTNNEINNIFGDRQINNITNWIAPADGYIYVSINFADNNRHYASVFPRDFIRGERCVASQVSDFGWQVMTLKVYKGLVYSFDLPEFESVVKVIAKFTYATGALENLPESQTYNILANNE